MKRIVIHIEMETTSKGDWGENGYFILKLDCGHTVARAYQIGYGRRPSRAPEKTRCELCEAIATLPAGKD